jgi:prefoldin subunit 5
MKTTTQVRKNHPTRQTKAMRTSNTRIGSLLAVLLLPIWVPGSARAQAPSRVTYEGFVTHENGSVVNGDTNVTFSLYDVESGGTALYQETQTLYVPFGNLSTEIGIVTPLDLTLFRENTDLYVGVTVEGESELSPRLRLKARPYAASAAYAGDALALQGLDPDDLLTGATPLAANVTYDNAGTGLSATTSQEAINALLARIQALEGQINGLQGTVDSQQTTISTLEDTASSQQTTISTLEATASSQQTQISTLEATSISHHTQNTTLAATARSHLSGN